MSTTSFLRQAGAMAALALAFGTSAAAAHDVAGAADVAVTAKAAMPLSVSSASVSLRPTTVGPVGHDGHVATTGPIAAGTTVRVEVGIHAGASGGGTVLVTTSDPAGAVAVTDSRNGQGQRCFGVGVDFLARVTVTAAAGVSATTATATGTIVVKLGDGTVLSYGTGDIALNGGAPVVAPGHSETIPVTTGVDVCLPAEVEATLSTATNLVGRVGIF